MPARWLLVTATSLDWDHLDKSALRMNLLTRIRSFVFEHPKLTPELDIDHDGWLVGSRVVKMPAHPSWHYDQLATPESRPLGVVWHYTATDFGTAKNMHKRRTKKRNPKVDRAASWHLTFASDGRIWQMVSLHQGAWHCIGMIPDHYGYGPLRVNRSFVGLELEGHGDRFTDEQLESVVLFARVGALIYRWGYPDLSWGHFQFDPERRSDPGPLFRKLLPDLLAKAGVTR